MTAILCQNFKVSKYRFENRQLSESSEDALVLGEEAQVEDDTFIPTAPSGTYFCRFFKTNRFRPI